MASVDLKAARSTLPIIILSVLSGGGGSIAVNKVWGPGGEWQEVVTNQARLQEQIVHTNDNVDKLSEALSQGIDKLVRVIERDESILLDHGTRLNSLELQQAVLAEQFRMYQERHIIP
tara:strand:- start:930 stop:1283 length:354 start_codon:yes stop_codon:yes gene_type:complete